MENKKRSISTKTFAILLAVVLIIGCMAGGTIAWLISTPDAVVNTFTYGDINIDLWEHEYNATTNTLSTTEKTTAVNNYKIIPGVDLKKDPTVTVEAGSEACWLFVKVEPTGTFVQDKVEYAIDDAVWTPLAGVLGVYYKSIDSVTQANTDYNVLKDKIVTVKDTLNKDDIKTLTSKTAVLKFTAYAVQKEGIADAATAWAKANA